MHCIDALIGLVEPKCYAVGKQGALLARRNALQLDARGALCVGNISGGRRRLTCRVSSRGPSVSSNRARVQSFGFTGQSLGLCGAIHTAGLRPGEISMLGLARARILGFGENI